MREQAWSTQDPLMWFSQGLAKGFIRLTHLLSLFWSDYNSDLGAGPALLLMTARVTVICPKEL